MSIRALSTSNAPAPTGAYSQGMSAGGFVFLAGHGPRRPDGEWLKGSFAEQAQQTFANLAALAEAAGGSLANAVRVGVYLRDLSNFTEMNEIYQQFFEEPFPARTTLQSDLPGFEIEVDAILFLGPSMS
jgi:2-iminobutanoate/2-iminopropanoate deaminase